MQYLVIFNTMTGIPIVIISSTQNIDLGMNNLNQIKTIGIKFI